MNVTEPLNIINYSIRTIVILFIECYIFNKLINVDKTKNIIISSLVVIITAILAYYVKNIYDSYYSVILLLISMIALNMFNYRKEIGNTIINTTISLGLSYLFLFLSIIINAIISTIFKIQNDYVFLILLSFVDFFLIWIFFKRKKIKNGLIFLQKKLENESMNLLLLNICMIILFTAMIIPGASLNSHVALSFILFAIMMFITIKKSLDAYYKQTLLIQDLNDTKTKLEEKTKEIEELEKENLEYGKRSHTLAHKQKILENKINELINSEIGIEMDLKDEVKNLSKQIYGEKKQTELVKTEVSSIDDVLKCMQNECISKNIDFELQVNGNIHYMINHFVGEEELQILIADHVKDAIIAIENSDNTNRSILVKIGEIDGIFSLYIYDSGIEFEKTVLDILGKKPVTTHKEDGGTGMGFMNTFETLKKYNASLIIKEIGKVSESDYTKIIMIRFDNNGEFKIETYK